MSKGDVYYLIHSNGQPVAKFEQDEDYMSGNCYQCYTWCDDGNGNYIIPDDWEFFANVYCKWDSCTHWWFYGENFREDLPKDIGGYYHICGTHCFTDHIRTMCFVWKLAAMILVEDANNANNDYTQEAYFKTEEIKQLIELTLKDYTIKKGE